MQNYGSKHLTGLPFQRIFANSWMVEYWHFQCSKKKPLHTTLESGNEAAYPTVGLAQPKVEGDDWSVHGNSQGDAVSTAPLTPATVQVSFR